MHGSWALMCFARQLEEAVGASEGDQVTGVVEGVIGMAEEGGGVDQGVGEGAAVGLMEWQEAIEEGIEAVQLPNK